MKQKFIYIKNLVLCIISLFFLQSCKIKPWRTTYFYSCKDYMKLDDYNEFKRISKFYPESECNGVFTYTVTNAYEKSLYRTEGLYSFTFVFYHYNSNVEIKINSLNITTEKECLHIDESFPIDVKTKYFENYNSINNTKLYQSKYMTGRISTGYIYDIKDYNNIIIEMNLDVVNNGKTINKTIKQKLYKKVEKGLFQFYGV